LQHVASLPRRQYFSCWQSPSYSRNSPSFTDPEASMPILKQTFGGEYYIYHLL
jgi:hypothetical protein